ncbi:glycosyltransferase [Zobellia galactanivorans]|uniref:glycosyltransferase n=1 Tax=Zobellia galactanivorans (strain DSM 12802 / CCUG 47099 / CIP 106680 / NCIMB 13871 / Dsij) TaxID=63186 RepID=UPI0026E12CAA|nr:glycosyltransferase [Zobellia galactanivorans]MDO6810410.1 glycosyltransferase [Zobellia galactanivorans]
MKILRIIPSMNPKQGGPCQGIRNAIPELLKMGVENEVVCFDNPDDDYIGHDSFVIHCISGAKTSWRYNEKLQPWLLANFHQYDVVIVHGLWQYHTYTAIRAIRLFRKNNKVSPKIYVMPHGMLDPYFQKAKERKIKALRNDIYWRIFENKVINRADGLLFTCEEELLLARTTFPNYQPKKEINVGYGIQPPPSRTAEMREAFARTVPRWNGKPYLLFLSRIHPKKGVDLLIRSYLRLEKEMEGLPQLIIAGPENHEYGKEMQALAAASPNILFSGMLSGNAKWGAFYESEAFVLPSHQENFGIAVVEALACSKPVLISDKVNIWREIERGTGGIVEKDTEMETYSLLKQWLSLSQSQKREMEEGAYEVYRNYFTIEQAANQFLKGIE